MSLTRTLDLHGTKHVQVLQKLEDFYLWKGKNTSSESIIITGDSVVMREIAMDFLDKYDFKYSSAEAAQELNNLRNQHGTPSPLALLLSSQHLAKRPTSEITAEDIKDAKAEIENSIQKQLERVNTVDVKDLIKINPLAVGQVLIQNPEYAALVCKLIHDNVS